MKKPLVIVSLCCIVVLAVSLTYVYLRHQHSNSTKRKAIVVERRDLVVTIQATGVVEPLNKVQILPPTSGRIDQILVQEGSLVQAGQKIAEMSSTNRAALLDIAQTKTSGEQANLRDAYLPTPIFAPVAGQIISKQVVSGQTVSQQSILFELSDQLIVRAQLDETDLGVVELGMLAEISVDSFPGQSYNTQVVGIAHQSKLVNNVNVYLVELQFKDKTLSLRSGMTANVNFITEKKLQVATIPAWAISQSIRGKRVSLMVENNKKVDITVGASDGKFYEISGLEPGTTVYIEMASLEGKGDGAKSPFAPASYFRPTKKKAP